MLHECEQDPLRYGENDHRPFSLNWAHYLEAHKIVQAFATRNQADSERGNDRSTPIGRRSTEPPRIPEENSLLPVDGHFSFFSDLLGFSKEVSLGGMDSLPDYYGAAFVAAGEHRNVHVYLLSDSCIAFAPAASANEFVRFVDGVVSNWLADGLMPQCVIAYGSFVERRPFAGEQPPNFFGTQITGTSLPDAVIFLKNKRPAGSRILMTDAARSNWPSKHSERIIADGHRRHEFLPQRTSAQRLFDCVYYLLCLREHDPEKSAFDHYVWTFASRSIGGVRGLPKLAIELVSPAYADRCVTSLETVISRIKRVVDLYEIARTPIAATDHERRANAPEMVDLLVRHRNRNQRSDRASLRKEVGDLVYTDPFAFLVGAAFDRGMRWQKAWEIPYQIDLKGYLDAAQLAAMEAADLQRLLESLPVKPRYGCTNGARTLSDASKLVMRFDAGGDAGAIWDDASPSEVQRRLESVHGIGPGIAHMTIRILRDDWGKFRGQESEIDVKPDVHVTRVFKRAGLTRAANSRQALEAARRLNPRFPGELDWPAWDVGVNWCRPADPLCGACPLTVACPKLV